MSGTTTPIFCPSGLGQLCPTKNSKQTFRLGGGSFVDHSNLGGPHFLRTIKWSFINLNNLFGLTLFTLAGISLVHLLFLIRRLLTSAPRLLSPQNEQRVRLINKPQANNIAVFSTLGLFAFAAMSGIMSSPGIIVNGELFSVGGLDKDKLIAKIKALS